MTIYEDRLEVNKISNEKLESEKYIYYNENHNSLTIGRDRKCDISFVGDKGFSRVQCRLIYDKDLKIWSIKDGAINMPSTNGTW